MKRFWIPAAALALAAGLSAGPAAGLSAGPVAGQDAGDVFRDCAECPEMVALPPGSFTMGSPASEAGRDDDEGPQRRVRIGYRLAVVRYEVTHDEWDACVAGGGCKGYRPDADYGRGRQPVINVNWSDARSYALWLSRKTGEEYRLLTEAEWEYAARAGTRTAYHFGARITPENANYHELGTVPVGSYKPNGFGLYDMHGNVEEWVEDCWNGSYEGAPSDGSAWTSGDCVLRVLRGGSWAQKIRCTVEDCWNGRSAPRAATGSPTLSATTSTSGFELPGRSPLDSLLPYVRGPGAERPAVFFRFPVLETGGTQCPVSEGVRLIRDDKPGWSGRQADGPSEGGWRAEDRAGAGSPLPFRAVAGAGSGALSEKPDVPLGRPDAGRDPGRAGKLGRV